MAVTRDDDLRVRLGRVRSRGGLHERPFITQALVAAQKAGGFKRRIAGDDRQPLPKKPVCADGAQ